MNCRKADFRLPPEEHYLNCAFFSPSSRSVEAAAMTALVGMRNPSDVTTDMFFAPAEDVRAGFAKLVGAAEPGDIAILPSVSYGMAIVAKNSGFEAGQKIVLVEEQFPSNVYVWLRLAEERGGRVETVPRPISKHVAASWTAAILDAIDGSTGIVALPNVHWTDGTWFDLEVIAEQARDHGALLIVDGSQSVGAAPFDVSAVKPDALVCAGYKWLFGPYGIALGYFGQFFSNGVPLEENWIARKGSERFGNLVHYQGAYQPGVVRYDVGERSNFILLPMMAEALRQVNTWGVENIQAYCRQIVAGRLDRVSAEGFQIQPPSDYLPHLFGVRVPQDTDIDHVRARLTAHRVRVSLRGSALRVGPNVYNDEDDIDALVTALLETRHR